MRRIAPSGSRAASPCRNNDSHHHQHRWRCAQTGIRPARAHLRTAQRQQTQCALRQHEWHRHARGSSRSSRRAADAGGVHRGLYPARHRAGRLHAARQYRARRRRYFGRFSARRLAPEALRSALLAARGVVHAPPGATPSGAQSDRVIQQLGLTEKLSGRVTHKVGLAGGLAAIASGEATLGIFPKSEIVSVPGITLAGSLPPSLQLTITYGAGVTAGSEVAAPAADFIRFLIEPESRKIWNACGFDPPD